LRIAHKMELKRKRKKKEKERHLREKDLRCLQIVVEILMNDKNENCYYSFSSFFTFAYLLDSPFIWRVLCVIIYQFSGHLLLS